MSGCLDCLAAATSSPAPWAHTLRGVGMVAGAVVAELEVFGALSKAQLVPAVLSRKLTHIFCGVGTALLLATFPAQFWPARLAVSSVLFAFMGVFAWIAEMKQEDYALLPGFVRGKVDRMVVNMCRSGSRRELATGTWYYSYIISLAIVLFWTSPVNAVVFGSLFVGDGLADPIGRTLGGLFKRPGDDLGPLQYRVLGFGTKSLPGSLGFFLTSYFSSLAFARFYQSQGHFIEGFNMEGFSRVVLFACLAATAAEAVSPPGKDNLTVPLAVTSSATTLRPGDSVGCYRRADREIAQGL
eukprot:CAMPEP_0118850326 /NCGR_PEP_ID=MMETSP1163-20130328/233_1 /TAXON_ID=124430 /ORGANISM="Phaeomonas parva, Strain CCMP2877" /LENGTH=297 /DNA_ID=CAMNT_0006782529 /DNA_START=119 /DNA_END=1013 /DNA_ORIENTATION=+